MSTSKEKKQKWTVYALAPLVVGVWGMVVYRILYPAGLPTGSNIPKTFNTSTITAPTAKIETFNLLLSYIDPFLSSEDAPISEYNSMAWNMSNNLPSLPQVSTTSMEKKPAPVVKPPVKKALVASAGKISIDSGEMIYLLSIDGKLSKLKLGQSIGNVSLTAASNDSLWFTQQVFTFSIPLYK